MEVWAVINNNDKDDLGDYVGKAYSIRYEVYGYSFQLSQYSKQHNKFI